MSRSSTFSEGMLRPPSIPQLPAPLPRQRAGGGHLHPNPVAGALMTERRTVMVSAASTRQAPCIGNNLYQIARSANTHDSEAEAVDVNCGPPRTAPSVVVANRGADDAPIRAPPSP